jgi:hypothetical protein
VIDPVTGQLDWTPQSNQVGTSMVIVHADDGRKQRRKQRRK